jgi:dolichol-phosphate mannosyltransferase
VILIPTFNEAANVGPLHDLIRSRCSFEMLFIDDGSPDGTADAVRELAATDPGVHLLERDRKEGLGNAYRAAYRRLIEEGRWDRVFMMDADLSHQPRHLAALDAALDGSDMVIGSRYLRGVSVLNWSIVRLNLSFAANRYIRTMTGMPFTDCTSGFRAFRAAIVPVLLQSSLRAGGYAFLVETLHGAWVRDLRITEVPIVFVERERGSSKVSPGVFMESLMTPARLLLRRWFFPRQ